MPPSPVLLRLMYGMWFSQVVYVLAELGIADRLQDGPRSAATLALETDSHSPTLYRVLRAAAALGLLVEDGDNAFSLTSEGVPLCTGAPGSVRSYARMVGAPWYWQSYGGLLESVRGGHVSFEMQYGKPFFDYLGEHGEAGHLFDAAMQTSLAPLLLPLVKSLLAHYPDLAAMSPIVDVGGGTGGLLGTLLQQAPTATGVLFDRPAVLPGAQRVLQDLGVVERCKLVPGSFFESVPSGGGLYLLKTVLHDWDDAHALSILRTCRNAMDSNSRLLIVELLIIPGQRQDAPLADLQVLLLLGGRERTLAEFEALASAAGLRITRRLPTATQVFLIEAETA